MPVVWSAPSQFMPWLAPELQPLLAIAVAELEEDGTLVAANAGFLRIIAVGEAQPIGAPAARFFIQPNFAALAHAQPGAGGEVYRGLLTIGDYMGRTRSLRARFWRAGTRLRMLAEYDIEELERIHDTVLELNREYGNAQLELTQTNLKLQQREGRILALSLTDPLTGVGNRRRFDEALPLEISRASRTGGKLSLFMADLDHFKRVNDNHGHEAGDNVLAAFGTLLRQQTRDTDIVTRFGGEEFVGLLPHTDLQHALITAERIRGAFSNCRVEPLRDPVTVSFGVVELAPGEKGDLLLKRADMALYRAKQLGRNRVVAG